VWYAGFAVCEWIGLVWQHDVCPVQCSVHLVHVVDRDSAFGIMICSVLIVLLIGVTCCGSSSGSCSWLYGMLKTCGVAL